MDTLQRKSELVAQLKARLEAELNTLSRSVSAAREAATHAEAKPENKYDTRGLEASYLAGAQAERLAELQAAVTLLANVPLRAFGPDAKIQATALVAASMLEAPDAESVFFVMPVGAGQSLADHDGRVVLTVTAQSPLGRALIGKIAGETATVTTAQGPREYEILSVC